MYLIIFCFLISQCQLQTDFSMTVVWGVPVDAKAPDMVEGTWEKCVELCYRAKQCVMAHGLLHEETCSLYKFGDVTTVRASGSCENSLVAFKVSTSSSSCPSDTAIYKNQSVSFTDETVENTVFQYNITFVDSLWSFEYQTIENCPATWGRFERFKGSWCLKVFASRVYAMNYTEAQGNCSALGGVVAALDSAEELKFAVDHGYILMNWKEAMMWVNGYRKPDAVYNSTVTSWSNADKTALYDITDPMATNVTGYWWSNTQPQWSDQYCLALWTNHRAYETEDMGCGSSPYVYAYICGRYPGSRIVN